jgi:hypothetical protein
MASREVTCIRKQERDGKVVRVTHVGGCGANGERWCLTAQEAIEQIEKGETTFWLKVEGRMLGVSVGQAKGRKWLRTHHDLARSDYLWGLPDCPESEDLRS